MTSAASVIGTLLSHGVDTLYALPGVQNDLLFDALFKASDRMRTVHARHEQTAAYMALGAALATDQPDPRMSVVRIQGHVLDHAERHAAIRITEGEHVPTLRALG